MCKNYLFSENGGAVAYIANPNLSYFNENLSTISGICQQKDDKPQLSVGKMLTSSLYFNSCYEVLGDPAINSMIVKNINASAVYEQNNKIHCTIGNDDFINGTCRWQVTKKTTNCREPVVYEGELTIESKTIKITIPDSIAIDSTIFKCFIWNDSMAGNAGCSFNGGSKIVKENVVQDNSVYCKVKWSVSGMVGFTFSKPLSNTLTASFYNISGRLLCKTDIPSGVNLFNYKYDKKCSASLSVVILSDGKKEYFCHAAFMR